jgi:hypothetical protein
MRTNSAVREICTRPCSGLRAEEVGEGFILEGQRIVSTNEAFCKIRGYSEAELAKMLLSSS